MRLGQLEKVARYIYEAARLEAIWSKRAIIPEPWEKRDEAFRNQFVHVVEKYLKAEKLPTPKEAHESWMREYVKMGWKYGKVRNPALKTHPDLVPYDELPQDEKDKDSIFLVLVWLTKQFIKQEIGGES
jgi:hypothetical protein